MYFFVLYGIVRPYINGGGGGGGQPPRKKSATATCINKQSRFRANCQKEIDCIM